jgi:hypothetical protein
LVVGGFLGAKFVPKDAGLAGGAIVLGYALMTVLGVLLVGGILVWKLPPPQFTRVFRIVGILALVALGLLAYRFFTHVKPEIDQQKLEQKKSRHLSKPTVSAPAIDEGRPPSGIGMSKPLLFPKRPLGFYEKPDAPEPFDELVFKNGEHFIEVARAPDDFLPEYQKLDYDLFFFRTMSQEGEWLEIEINRDSGKTAWVRKDDVVWQPWSVFLPNVYAIEHLRPQDFPVREEPLNHAAPLPEQPTEPWQVERVEGDWVKLKNSGWLRWRWDGKEMVRFVYLS